MTDVCVIFLHLLRSQQFINIYDSSMSWLVYSCIVCVFGTCLSMLFMDLYHFVIKKDGTANRNATATDTNQFFGSYTDSRCLA